MVIDQRHQSKPSVFRLPAELERAAADGRGLAYGGRHGLVEKHVVYVDARRSRSGGRVDAVAAVGAVIDSDWRVQGLADKIGGGASKVDAHPRCAIDLGALKGVRVNAELEDAEIRLVDAYLVCG